MKKTRNWLTPLLLALLLLAYTVCMSACRSPERDERNLSDTEYAVNSVAAVDALGRVTIAADSETDRDVGLFYFLWLGSHASGVYDVSKLEEESPEELFDPTSKVSPQGAYHFWGEPLYGYYNSEDEWVITRHVELFTMAGIDFLMFDTTNAVIYERVVSKVLQVLDKYQKQGWDVPKIGFLTNSNTKGTVTAIYNTFYTEGKDDYYPDLWYSPNGKPLITSNTMYYDETVPEDKKLLDFFEIRDIQWPDSPYYEDDAFTWMDWNYKQHNHNGQMSVSVAQHTSGKMSNQSDNCGRGYNFSTFQNEADGVLSGSNFEAQWQTAIENKEVKTAFITGWNEWIALKKYEYGECFFVDLYNMEYSRDVEMMKGGYGDNFYLQMLRNVRAFKYTDAKEYELPATDMSRADAWDSVQKYPDFVGDAMERNFRAYHGSLPDYVDTTNRNDIVNVQVAHDGRRDRISAGRQWLDEYPPRHVKERGLQLCGQPHLWQALRNQRRLLQRSGRRRGQNRGEIHDRQNSSQPDRAERHTRRSLQGQRQRGRERRDELLHPGRQRAHRQTLVYLRVSEIT